MRYTNPPRLLSFTNTSRCLPGTVHHFVPRSARRGGQLLAKSGVAHRFWSVLAASIDRPVTDISRACLPRCPSSRPYIKFLRRSWFWDAVRQSNWRESLGYFNKTRGRY